MNKKGISSDLIVYGVREPTAVKVVKETLKEGDIVVDIGANMGYYALLESSLVGETGKVFAIEPVPESLELLQKNIELNKRSNIETFQMAIGDKNGEDSIFLSDMLNLCSMIYHDGITTVGGSVKKIPVNVATLDTFLEDKPLPNFIRMDVEGYEFEIIRGMKGLLERKCPLKVFIEVHPAYLGKKRLANMLDTLKGYGFYCEVATDGMLHSRSYLLQKAFYALSHKINEDSKNGYLYRDSDLDDLKKFGSQQVYPQVLFARK